MLPMRAIAVVGLVMSIAPVARAQLQPPPPLMPPPPIPQQQGPMQQGPMMGAPPPGAPITQAEREDSGRGLEFLWANAEVGGSYVDPRDPPAGGGAMLGAALGLRMIFGTLGARFRVHPESGFTMYQINGEAGFHLPLGPWDPYANIHAGYAGVSANKSGYASPGGFDLGLSLGGDRYFGSLFSVGLDATFDTMFFARTGVALSGSLHAGLHFDL